MALATFKCTRCNVGFTAGEWHCKDGGGHTVTPKTYYVLDAPADKRDCKNARLQILNVVPERTTLEPGGTTRIVPGTHIEFVRGLFETDDPRIQAALDTRPKVLQGEEGRAAWENAYFSDTEKHMLKEMKLKGENSRLENERNQLLEQIQKLKKGA